MLRAGRESKGGKALERCFCAFQLGLTFKPSYLEIVILSEGSQTEKVTYSSLLHTSCVTLNLALEITVFQIDFWPGKSRTE